MDSREHVFDVAIVAPVKDGVPVVLYRASVGAKDEDAAKVKAVEAAREAKVSFDLDVVEILVTRPFTDKSATTITWPGYIPANWYCPAYPDYPAYPQPVWYATGPVFTSGYMGFGENIEYDIKVTVGSTTGD